MTSRRQSNPGDAVTVTISDGVKSRLQQVLPSLMLQEEHGASHLKELLKSPALHGLDDATRPILQHFETNRDAAVHAFEEGRKCNAATTHHRQAQGW